MFLEHKAALVTGATGAIGLAICEEVLKSGIKNLAALDIHLQEPQSVKNLRNDFPKSVIEYFKVDVTSDEELQQCYKSFTNKVGYLDVVVNCAGLFNEKDYKNVLAVNLGGVIASTLFAIDYMRVDTGKGRGGIVLNISSLAGLDTYGDLPIYGATKHGVVAFTRAVSHEREKLGIKFLVLCPAATDSAFFNRLYSKEYLFLDSLESKFALNPTTTVQRFV